MDAKQNQWITDLTGVATASQKEEEQDQQKAAILSQLNGEISEYAKDAEEKKRGIRGVKVKRGLLDKNMKMLDYTDRDQTEEFDLDELHDDWAVTSQEDLARVGDLLNTTEKWANDLRKQLSQQKVKVKVKKPLPNDPNHEEEEERSRYTDEELDQEIATEVYTPLVRRGLLPETFVPDEFSETKKIIDGSFKGYADRHKQEQVKGFWESNKGLISSSVGLLASGVSTLTTGVKLQEGLRGTDAAPTYQQFTDKSDWSDTSGRWLSNMEPTAFWKADGDPTSDPTKYGNFLPNLSTDTNVVGYLSDLVMGKAFDIKEAKENIGAVKETGEGVEATPGRVVSARPIAKGCIQALSGAAIQAFAKAGGPLAVAAGGAVGASLDEAAIVKAIHGKDPKAPFDGGKNLQALLANGLKDAIEGCAKKANDPLKGQLNTAAAKMATEFGKQCSADALNDGLKEEDGKVNGTKVVNLVFKAAASAAQAVENDIDQAVKGDPGGVDALTNAIDEEMVDQFEKHKKAVDKQSKEELDLLQNETDAERLAGVIEAKTAQLKADMGLIKLMSTVSQMTIDQAAMFFAPLGMLSSGIKMIQNAYEAVKRMKDWAAFAKSRRDMLNAASAFSAPVKSFVDTSRAQWANYSFTAVMEGIKIAGAALQCSGVGLAVGVGMQATVGSLEALESFIVECAKKMDLKTAWEQYKLALRRPANRKIALVAMQKNPTLAKYAVAYGCMVMKDPLVGDFMTACGLNEDKLRDPRASLDVVVSYLEARMPDDITVVGIAETPVGGWAPAKIEVTLNCWNRTRAGAEKAGVVKPVSTTELDKALARFDVLRPDARNGLAQKPNDPATVDLLERCADTLDVIRWQMAQYLTEIDKQAGGKADRDLRRTIQSLRSVADKEYKDLEIDTRTSRKAAAELRAKDEEEAEKAAI